MVRINDRRVVNSAVVIHLNIAETSQNIYRHEFHPAGHGVHVAIVKTEGSSIYVMRLPTHRLYRESDSFVDNQD